MRCKLMMAIILCLMFVIACAPKEPAAPAEPIPETPVIEEPVKPELEPEPEPELTPEERCYENAKALIPETFDLSIASNHDPNGAGWDLVTKNWTDGTNIGVKGDLEFIKGRLSGENTRYWYTRNNQNENLFGVGGLKYVKKTTASDGRVGENSFMIKPILNPLAIHDPQEPFGPYTGLFEVVDYGFVECNWLE